MLLQEDLNNLESWSNSCGLVFNEEKCKSLSITRCNEPIVYPYKIKGKQLTSTPTEKDLGIWIASDLTWSKHVLNRCARAFVHLSAKPQPTSAPSLFVRPELGTLYLLH